MSITVTMLNNQVVVVDELICECVVCYSSDGKNKHSIFSIKMNSYRINIYFSLLYYFQKKMLFHIKKIIKFSYFDFIFTIFLSSLNCLFVDNVGL